MKSLVILALLVAAASAQFDSPAPPRISIPGAIQVGVRPSGFRQARLQAPQGLPAPARIRRPGLGRPSFKSVDASPRPSLQSLEEPAKPVTEEPEDDLQDVETPTAYVPSFFTTEPPSDPFDFGTTTQQPKPLFTGFQQSTPPAFRPEARPPQQYRPFSNPTPIRYEAPAKPQPVRVQPLSQRPQRPQLRPEPRPQLFQEDEDAPIQPVRQFNRAPDRVPARQPIESAPVRKYNPSTREKKPVAQVIRKFRDDNPDGSITWGFENDDGSFKEETIGIDCVTRGKYGYVDPDGLKREYSYETGILCDKTQEEREDKGFIDWQDNKAVLPNGVTIDLATMGKKSKRPFRSPSLN